LRDFANSDDVLGALKDIAKKLNKHPNQVDIPGFVAALKSSGSRLPLRDVSLTPHLESRRSDGYVLRFLLENTGNQNINLAHLVASVPKTVIGPNWTPHSDPAVIDPANENRNGSQYLRLRYTTYQGTRTSNHPHVERLPAVLPPDTRLELGRHFSFPIKPALSEAEKTLPIYYRIVALDATFPPQTTTIGDLLDQLKTASENSQQTEEPADSPQPNQRPRNTDEWRPEQRRDDWLGGRGKNWFRR
jgi:hypothetical protein